MKTTRKSADSPTLPSAGTTGGSLLALCRAIYDTAGVLPVEEKAAITRTYASSWALVTLAVDRLSDPTEASRPRLQELYRVVDLARVDHLKLYGPGDVVAWVLICDNVMTGTITDRSPSGVLTVTRPDGGVCCVWAGKVRRATPQDKALALAFYTTAGYRSKGAVAETARRQAGYAITAPDAG